MVLTCDFFWGSHGCDLPKRHRGSHRCIISTWDDDGLETVTPCCEYDETVLPGLRVRHYNDSQERWGEWGPYGEGWRQ
jgi:hypothetical protein